MVTLLHKVLDGFSQVETQLTDFEGEPGDKDAVKQQVIMKAFNLADMRNTDKFIMERVRNTGALRISFKRGAVPCPKCGSYDLNKNGYNNYNRKGSALRKIGIEAVLTNHKCKRCKANISITPKDVLPIIKDICDLIDKRISTLREDNRVPYGQIAKGIEQEFGIQIHESTVARHYKTSMKKVLTDTVTVPEEPHSGYYSYDEQVLKVNGREVFRLTLIDAVTRRLIKEEMSDRATKDAVKDFIKRNVDRVRVKAFVVDGKTMYPPIISELFGKKIGIQQCIRHVMGNVSDDYKKTFMNHTLDKNIPFRELYWKQRLFDVLFPRPEILAFVDTLRMKEIRNELSKEEAILARREYYELIKEHRRTASSYLDGYTKEEADKKFEEILRNIDKYPKSVKRRIGRMRDKWPEYTLYLADMNVPPTNNVVEQYYARTAQKTQKKRFRSDDAVDDFIEMNNKLKDRSILEFLDPCVSVITLAVIFSRIAELIAF